jgi:hypothetical protein
LENRYLATKMYTDTFFKDKVSARGNTCAQQFVMSKGFVAGKPLKTKADDYTVLEYVCRKYGVPNLLGEWGRVVKQNLIQQSMSEPHSGWQSQCGDEIREVRKNFQCVMAADKCPEAFWDLH